MTYSEIFLFLASCRFLEGASGGSVPYNANTHVAVKSSGCGKASPYASGHSVTATATYVNKSGVSLTATYIVKIPNNYNQDVPLPVVFQFPGWTMSARTEEQGAGISGYTDEKGFISVTPQGPNDNSPGKLWYSWNAAGTSKSPGLGGSTCTQAASHPGYCYESCGSCTDEPQCYWTTCDNTITPTGSGLSTDQLGYIPQLLDTLEDQLCIDTTREYIAGESNGGIMAYQTCAVLASRVAACVPQFGSFMKGFNVAPDIGVALMDTHGSKDTTVPANVSLSGDGYYYTTTHDIFNGNQYNSKGWKDSNNCSGDLVHYPTSYDGIMDLWCGREGTCTGGDLVRCTYTLGHQWFDNGGKNNGGLITEFLLKWSKPSHIGMGYSDGALLGSGRPMKLIKVSDLDEDSATELPSSEALLILTPRKGGHYGNPAEGCLDDEEVISVGSGYACAPMIGANRSVDGVDGPPSPKCKIGGVAALQNGCPMDASIRDGGVTWPICLGKDNSTAAYDNGHFHCLLVCPCGSPNVHGKDHKDRCSDASHDHCPRDARCERSELRARSHGVCTYPDHKGSTPMVV